MRLFPAKFSSTETDYVKSVSIGIVDNTIVLYDSHGDIIDISSSVSKFKLKRLSAKLSKII